MKFYKIVNPNRIIFLADGRRTTVSYRSFPFYIECLRNKEYPYEGSDFYAVNIVEYVDINESEEFGPRHIQEPVSPNTVLREYNINGVKVTFTGVVFIIGPAKGKEYAFNPDDITIPPVKTYFNKDESKFIIELYDTKMNGLDSTVIKEGNYFINSLSLSTNGDDTIVKIDLKNPAKYYRITGGEIKRNNENISSASLPILGISYAEVLDIID